MALQVPLTVPVGDAEGVLVVLDVRVELRVRDAVMVSVHEALQVCVLVALREKVLVADDMSVTV